MLDFSATHLNRLACRRLVGNMEKIKLPFFYLLGAALNPVTRLVPGQVTWAQVYLWAVAAKPYIEDLFKDYPLTVCKPSGTELMAEIDYWTDTTNPAAKAAIAASNTAPPPLIPVTEQYKAQELVNKAREFEAILSAELQTLATYQVSQKGIFSMPALIEATENIFPDEIRAKLPTEAQRDIRESGRCLAFDNATACGFHMLRATETVIHAYYVAVCKPSNPKKPLSNWGQYVIELKKNPDADIQRVATLIDNLREHDRNLIMHPEIFLDNNDAFTLFTITQGVIIAMAGRLP